MFRYYVTQKCYYGEPGERPRLMYRGEIYQSATLKPADAPKFLELRKSIPAAEAPEAPKPEVPAEGEMGYHEMKTFVVENGIEVENFQKPTLVAAIAAFKAAQDAQEDAGEDGEGGDDEVAAETPSDEE